MFATLCKRLSCDLYRITVKEKLKLLQDQRLVCYKSLRHSKITKYRDTELNIEYFRKVL